MFSVWFLSFQHGSIQCLSLFDLHSASCLLSRYTASPADSLLGPSCRVRAYRSVKAAAQAVAEKAVKEGSANERHIDADKLLQAVNETVSNSTYSRHAGYDPAPLSQPRVPQPSAEAERQDCSLLP